MNGCLCNGKQCVDSARFFVHFCERFRNSTSELLDFANKSLELALQRFLHLLGKNVKFAACLGKVFESTINLVESDLALRRHLFQFHGTLTRNIRKFFPDGNTLNRELRQVSSVGSTL